MKRAYALLTLKSFDEDAREITGWATTPTPDRMQDIVEPDGASYKLPVPLLWQHDSSKPIGHVTQAKVSEKGIEIKAQIAKVDEPGSLKDRLDEAWQSIKTGLVQGLSIGFRGIETADIKGTWGIRFIKWEWLELSAVTVPANAEASIQTIKSIDERLRAASGREQEPDPPPDVSGTKSTASRRFFFARNKGNDVKTVREQIEALEAARQAKAARMSEIMQKSIDEGRSTDEAEQEEFDGLEAEVKAAESDLKRLRTLESLQVAKAVPVKPDVGTDPEAASKARAGYITVQPNVEKGQDFVRFCMAAMQAKGNPLGALAIANARWKDANRVITSLKAAVDAGSTSDSTWASPLVEYQTMASEFIELLRPMTLMGRIPGGLRRVPFNVRMQRQTAGVTGSFVGEGMPKPVNELAFDAVTLGHHKAAVIVVMTMELARFSDPSAEAVVRQDLIDGLTAFLDKRFIDPQYSGSTSAPASITNGLVPINSTGATIAAITQDVENLMAAFIAANLNLSRAVWIMSPSTALSLSMKRNNQDQFAFPTVTPDGGTFFGRPVLTSNHVAAAGSPTEQLIVLMDPSEIFLADDGGFSIDMSQEASLQMDSAPSAGAQSLVSLWQNNLAALRAERSINWMRRRDQAVQLLGNANW